MIRSARLAAVALLFALLAASSASAMPMPPRPVLLQNADGTTLTARVFGDEFLSWAEDLDGYTLTYDRADGAWHYAKAGKDGKLLPHKARPGRLTGAQLKLKKHLRPGKTQLARAFERRLKTQRPLRDASSLAKTAYLGATGNTQMLAVLVRFNCPVPPPPDGECLSSNITPTFQPTDYGPVFNGPTGSVKDYYSAASSGKLQLSTTIYPDWVQLAHNDAYYAYNEKRYPDGIPSTVPVAEMLSEVVAYLDAQGFNFAPYADAGGNIAAITLIHIGRGFEESNNEYSIHSHEMFMSQPVVTKGGQRIFGYTTGPEVMGSPSKITTIGVICHETGHALGLPDLYDTSYYSAGLGGYSLMAAGSWGGPNADGSVPVLPDVWSRVFLGWVKPARITSTTNGVRLRPAVTSLDAVVLPSGMPGSQYFLLENRSKSGYDQFLPADGLAIYHVDDLMADNTPPDSYSHYRVALEEADGDDQLVADPAYLGGPNDLYPSTTPLNNQFTPTSTPASLGYDLSTSQISVTNITKVAPDVTFDVGITITGKLDDGFTCLSTAECKSGNCVDGVCCDTACNAGICDACSRVMGAQVDGTCFQHNFACNDGDLCTDNDACGKGVCAGAPKQCPAADGCHETSVCDPKTGLCSNVAKPDDTACDDADECTTGDHCASGVCVGTARAECPPPDQCHVPAACQNKKCLPYGVKPELTPCDDGKKCTLGDACLHGACVGTPVKCEDPGDCYNPVTCDEGTGACLAPVMRANGASCDDRNACTMNDACNTGLCKGVVDTTVVDCPAPDACHDDGKCSATGECLAPSKPDGTACDNGDKCLRNQKCVSGACTGTPVVCNSPDPCSEQKCVPSSGQCQMRARAEGEACTSDDPCVVNASCRAGECLGDDKECAAEDECHTGGTCNSMDGKCHNPGLAPDGKKCTGGTCKAGACVPDPVDAGSGLDAAVAAAAPLAHGPGGAAPAASSPRLRGRAGLVPAPRAFSPGSRPRACPVRR